MGDLCGRIDDAWQLAYRLSRRWGMNHDESDEWALEFVEHLFEEDYKRMTAGQAPHDWTDALLVRSAHNFVFNRMRDLRRLRSHEVLVADDAVVWSLAEGSQRELLEDVVVDRLDKRQRIERALARLDPAVREMFLRRFRDEQSYRELSDIFDRSPHAIEQAIDRAKTKMRERQTQTGVDSTPE